MDNPVKYSLAVSVLVSLGLSFLEDVRGLLVPPVVLVVLFFALGDVRSTLAFGIWSLWFTYKRLAPQLFEDWTGVTSVPCILFSFWVLFGIERKRSNELSVRHAVTFLIVLADVVAAMFSAAPTPLQMSALTLAFFVAVASIGYTSNQTVFLSLVWVLVARPDLVFTLLVRVPVVALIAFSRYRGGRGAAGASPTKKTTTSHKKKKKTHRQDMTDTLFGQIAIGNIVSQEQRAHPPSVSIIHPVDAGKQRLLDERIKKAFGGEEDDVV